MNANEQIRVAFEEVERCHTLLADFFPHAGMLELGGSKSLLGTRLMPVLQDCAIRVRDALLRLDESPPDARIVKLHLLEVWLSMIGLLERLSKSNSKHEAAEVNNAARLLYLASGTSWNYLRGLAPGEPPHNPQYIRVEPMLPLLKRCGRESEEKADVAPKQLAQRLAVELNDCLR